MEVCLLVFVLFFWFFFLEERSTNEETRLGEYYDKSGSAEAGGTG